MTAAPFPTSSPSREGIDPAAILELLDAVDANPRIEPHGLIIQRHGRRVLEAYWQPHRPGQARLVYSLSKSFTGAALALAVGDGLLSLDDLVADHLPEAVAEADERTRRMRIRHIASMSSGHQDETLLHAFLSDPTDIVRAFLHLPPEHEPGTWFAYNQPPVLALATVLQRLTGQRLVDQLRARVLDPLGIDDLRWYQYQPGIDLGFSGVYTHLDAIARFGQLHLDDGCVDGRRVLPEGWIDQASRPQVENPQRPEPDWSQGYGFQLWMCRHGYRGDGAYGQYMVVLPEQDTVVTFFSNTEPMQPFLDLLWDGLVPAIDRGCDPDPEGDRAVAERTAGLHLPTAAERTGSPGTGAPPAAGRFTRAEHGHHHHTITEVLVGDGHLTIHEGDEALRVPLGDGWVDVPGHPIAASATVDDEGGVTVDLAMLATPHRLELTTDPGTSTFRATWPLPPLFGLGLDPVLARMHPPED
jgi:CubicO group peptidase (beta-lactamase class C family)